MKVAVLLLAVVSACTSCAARPAVKATASTTVVSSPPLVIEAPCIAGVCTFRLGPVTDTAAEALAATLAHAEHLKWPLVVVVDSPGGSAEATLDIVAALKGAGVPVSCRVEKMAASGAAFTLGACPVVTARPWSRVMLHRARITGATSGQSGHYRSMADALEAVDRALCAVVAPRMKKTAAELYDDLGEQDVWMSAEEARAAGLVDEVRP